jgi:hypothetical protein
MAYITQVGLIMSVGIAYTQQLFMTLSENRDGLSIGGLDAAMVADQNIRALANLEYLNKVRIGALMALVAW